MPNHLHSLAQLVLGWFYKNRWLLLLAFLLGAAVHYQIWSNLLQNPDSIWIGQVYQADHWPGCRIGRPWQGRWGLWAVDAARGGMNVAALTALPMLTLYTVAAVLIADLFAIQGIFARLLAVLLVVWCAQCGRGGDLPLLQCLLRTLLLIGGAGRVLRRLRFCGKASTVWRGRRDPLPDAFPEFVSAGIAAGGGAFPVGPAATNFASAP